MNDIIVIGGGAAGCMAALTAAEQGARVLLLERNPKLGRKIYITGKGRCNVTNQSSVEEVLRNIPRNNKFLMSAMTKFSPADTMEFFEKAGVALKVERGNRVFPQSDKAADIIDTLLWTLRRRGVSIVNERAMGIQTKKGVITGVVSEKNIWPCSAVIVATGGISYPLTGSTGDGYTMAEDFGHTIVPTKASLVPLVEKGDTCKQMQGLSLRNIAITVKNCKKKVLYTGQGELMFTHFGLTGPLILSASAHMVKDDAKDCTVTIDLKPALDEQELDKRLVREFNEQANRTFGHVLEALVPRTLIPVLVARSGIPSTTRANSITKGQRRQLLETLKGLTIEIQGTRPIAEAIVTVGGVKTSEVNPTTMESKLVGGLYFAGELLDLDGYTGGFNLQIAWATGRAAGLAAGLEAVAQKNPNSLEE